VKLLASVERTTLSSIFIGALERDLAGRLKRGLADIAGEIE
jgi:hypothetical protein